MEAVVLGLWADVKRHPPMEVSLYLLVFALLLLWTGRGIYSRRASFSYMRQVRCRTARKWWRACCLRAAAGSMAAVTALFLFSWGAGCASGNGPGPGWGPAFLLWQAGFLLLGMVQAVLVYLPGGGKWGFPLLMGLETLSVIFPALPGSFLMLRRSRCAAGQGFSPAAAVAGELVLSAVILLTGHNVMKWSQGYGSYHRSQKHHKEV